MAKMWPLRRGGRAWIGLAMYAGVLILSASGAEPQSPAPMANVSEQYLKTAADLERSALGLPPLRVDAALAAAARQHAALMAGHNSISHRYPDEPDLATRAATAGARFSLITENVAQAPSALKVHAAWMNSEGHRHNLLDGNVDSVGIAVVARDGQMFAVEDFSRSVPAISRTQQESIVARAVQALGVVVEAPDKDAYRIFAGGSGAESASPPSFVMRYTTSDLDRLPEELKLRVRSGKFVRAVVAACPMDREEGFSMYRLAVLLYGAG